MNEVDRIGGYVATELPRVLEREGVDWPVHVTWDELGVIASIRRGELLIPAHAVRTLWWEPATEVTGDRLVKELGRVLWSCWRAYRDADETGRMAVSLWRDAQGRLHPDPLPGLEPARGFMEPGCRLGEQTRSGRTRVYRLGKSQALDLESAVAQGWIVLTSEACVG